MKVIIILILCGIMIYLYTLDQPILTIVITSSPIPSHPSIEVMKQTIDSLSYLTLPPNTPVILTHDFGESESYDQYLKTLASYIQDKPNVKIVKKTLSKRLSNR